MSSRGTTALVVTWGSAGKQPCSYGRFREIATSNESHVFLAILATLVAFAAKQRLG